MRRLAIPFIIVIISTGCLKSANTVPTSPTYYANQVVIGINELSNTIIDLNSHSQISDDTTRVFGAWAVSALKVLNDIPNGWQKIILDGWNEAKAKFPDSLKNSPTANTTIAVIDALLKFLNPPGV